MTVTNEQIQHLVNCLNNGSELQIVCKDGQVHIPANSLFTWTYIGEFGSTVKHIETKYRIVYDNLIDRLSALQFVINEYSSKVACINIVTVK